MMDITLPGVKTRRTTSSSKVVKSAGEEVIKSDKQGRADRNVLRREQLNARILADSEWLSAKELSVKRSSKTQPQRRL
ncbi:TPA: hypothetical protein ACXE54_000962 [Klebsiella michiganensis]|uniref:hypothetical protein n=1 Tax=Klebsiella michiganensis TaxID=1134687 RepID=UPI0021AB6836|nr:hypothetical protein [Klebsiella michiganensis]MCW9463913.1 hypothetical protein [Klebsiella michiganensis]